MNLKDKVVLVTGGASGLGRATAEAMLAKGARVAIVDLNGEAARELAAQHGERALGLAVDVCDEASVQAAIDATIERFGAVHVCVNCAGVGVAGRTFGRNGALPLAEFAKVININLIGTFNVLRLAVATMSRNEAEDGERGVIVNTASGAAFDGQMGQAAYSASKAAVVGMNLPIARDLSNLGIRCNAIAPGLFETAMTAGLPPKVHDGLVANMEFPKRMGRPGEFAALACHIVENLYINGETIRLDAASRAPAR